MRFLIRALLLFFVVSALLSIVRGLLTPSSPGRRKDSGQPADGGKLVKDPVCGTYVAQSSALHAGGNYFCSEDCRRKFIGG